ncbi:MAG: hypothetical protein N0E48_27490, partial [Candidatus Thiodiazotropha endolucinida]|nr:hypothetical protein [Candidatus Thiodiazotropha taylori]MCW4347065.1 hypothetical protein [Candidatus Thiodiazotropha endolucinida]
MSSVLFQKLSFESLKEAVQRANLAWSAEAHSTDSAVSVNHRLDAGKKVLKACCLNEMRII